MKILADESVDYDVYLRLRTDGFEVLAVAELSPSAPDDSVLSLANSQTAVLLTHDKDFGELSYRLGRVHTGIVLSRLGGLSMSQKIEIVSQAFREHAEEFVGAFSVISAGSVRIRRNKARISPTTSERGPGPQGLVESKTAAMPNPWCVDFAQAPYVLEMDREIVEKFNKKVMLKSSEKLKSGEEHKHYLQVNHILPEPFVGAANAPVVLLSNNPGFNDEITIQGKQDKDFMSRIRGNLCHAPLKYPMIFLDPEYKGSEWWVKKLHHLIEHFNNLNHDGRRLVSQTVLNIVFFPYPSRGFGHRRLSVPSQEYSFELVRAAIRRDAVIIHMRTPDKWFEKIPELKCYKKAFSVLNYQRPVLTPHCPGYIESVAAIKQRTNL